MQCSRRGILPTVFSVMNLSDLYGTRQMRGEAELRLLNEHA